MKTFMTTIVAAALCMAASSGQVNAYRALQQDISFVSSSSVGSARAMTILGANEDSLLTMTDGRAVITALTEGDGIAAGSASVDAKAEADADLAYSLSESDLYARAFKSEDEATTYSDSNANVEVFAEEDARSRGVSGGGVQGESEAMMNEAGALASDFYRPYPHVSAVYSRSFGEGFANTAELEQTDGTTETEQVAVIDTIGNFGIFADAIADSASNVRAMYIEG